MEKKQNQNDQQKRLEAYMEAIKALVETESDPRLEERTTRMLDRLDARIEADRLRTRRVGRILRITALAASFVLVAALGWWGVARLNREPAPQAWENTTMEVRQVILPDGTRVCLQSGATLTFADTGEKRTTTLRGDAYFDVVRDTLHPFIVRTDALDVKVLGTAFSVSAPAGSGKADVVLERGSVRLMSKGGMPLLRLTPNQKAAYNASTGDISVEQVHAAPMIRQQYSIVNFENASVEEIIRAIEDNYGIKVSASGYDSSKQYHMSFLRSDPPGDVLAVLELLTGGHFSSNNVQ